MLLECVGSEQLIEYRNDYNCLRIWNLFRRPLNTTTRLLAQEEVYIEATHRKAERA